MKKKLFSACMNLLRDVRYALRGLSNAPGYAATVILTLALGLGAVTTMLAIVDSVLLRPVALAHPEQLVTLSMAKQGEEGTAYFLSYKRIEALRHDAHSFSAVGGYNTLVKPVGTADGTRMAVVTQVTPGFFRMLGIRAKFGRLLGGEEEKSPVAVVSATFWRQRLHGNPKVIGSTIRLSGQLRTVVGVLPEGVRFPGGSEAPVVYTPVALNAKGEDDLFLDGATVMARLKPGVSRQQARAEASSIVLHAATEKPANGERLEMHAYVKDLTGGIETALLALLGGVGVLLLIACANAANLQIARATGRMAEMQVRSALGASFGRLLQQALTESITVSLLGALAGGMLAYALVAAIRTAYGPQFARFDELAVHPAVLGACAVLAVLAGVLAALAPVLSIRRKTGPSSAARVTRRSRIPGALVVLQIALTCVLLVTGGLFTRTFLALEDVKLGFDPHKVTTLVLMPENQHKDPELSRQTITRLLEHFGSLPGVRSAMTQTSLPFSNFNMTLNGTTEVNGRPFHEGDSAFYSLVSTNFVGASGLHLLRGRELSERDDASAAMVAIVNEAFVAKFLRGRDPIGASLRAHRSPGDKDEDLPFTQPLTVVGVVENELQGGDLAAPYQPMVYMDYRQLPHGSGMGQVFSFVSEFAVRSTLPQAVLEKELRAAIKQAAPDMTEMVLHPMEEGIAQSLNTRRLALRLVAGFGVTALLLAAIGIYGVLAYSVAQRRKEIGIRKALGCSRGRVMQLVARQAGTMVLCGLIVGIAGAWPVGRAVKSFLFGVQALDAWAMISSAAVLLLVCAAAALLPAWNAAQLDPNEALRSE